MVRVRVRVREVGRACRASTMLVRPAARGQSVEHTRLDIEEDDVPRGRGGCQHRLVAIPREPASAVRVRLRVRLTVRVRVSARIKIGLGLGFGLGVKAAEVLPAQRRLALRPGGPNADGRGEVIAGRVEADVAVAPEREQLAAALAARAQRQLPRRLLRKQLPLRGRQRGTTVQQ